jgi:hypothetical protein
MSITLSWQTRRARSQLRILNHTLDAFRADGPSRSRDGLSLAALGEIQSQCEKLGDAPRGWWTVVMLTCFDLPSISARQVPSRDAPRLPYSGPSSLSLRRLGQTPEVDHWISKSAFPLLSVCADNLLHYLPAVNAIHRPIRLQSRCTPMALLMTGFIRICDTPTAQSACWRHRIACRRCLHGPRRRLPGGNISPSWKRCQFMAGAKCARRDAPSDSQSSPHPFRARSQGRPAIPSAGGAELPVCQCAIPPDAPRPFSSSSPAAPRMKMCPRRENWTK